MTDKVNTPVPAEVAGSDPTEIVQIENVDQFAHLIHAWHDKKVKILEHMLDIPSGTAMVVNGGPDVVLEGPFLDGFKSGLALALMELGKLPFVSDKDSMPEPAEFIPAGTPDVDHTKH